jgi:aquaporin Z
MWISLTAPLVGALAAVAVRILRGPGGGPSESRADQGALQQPATRHR